jgi:hypothetical protein
MDDQGQLIHHVRANNFVDEQVDQFDAFSILWNGQEAVHVTFGRTSLTLKNSVFLVKDGATERATGDVDVHRLDVAAMTMSLDVARQLAEVLQRMIKQAGDRSSANV